MLNLWRSCSKSCYVTFATLESGSGHRTHPLQCWSELFQHVWAVCCDKNPKYDLFWYLVCLYNDPTQNDLRGSQRKQPECICIKVYKLFLPVCLTHLSFFPQLNGWFSIMLTSLFLCGALGGESTVLEISKVWHWYAMLNYIIFNKKLIRGKILFFIKEAILSHIKEGMRQLCFCITIQSWRMWFISNHTEVYYLLFWPSK